MAFRTEKIEGMTDDTDPTMIQPSDLDAGAPSVPPGHKDFYYAYEIIGSDRWLKHYVYDSLTGQWVLLASVIVV